MKPGMTTPPGAVASGKAAEEGNLRAQNTKHGTVRARIKSAIVRAGLAGIIPYAVADWLIQAGGLSHD